MVKKSFLVFVRAISSVNSLEFLPVQRGLLQNLKDVYFQEICKNLTVTRSPSPLADLKISLQSEQLS